MIIQKVRIILECKGGVSMAKQRKHQRTRQPKVRYSITQYSGQLA